ncbi:MAG: hypothetical protein LRY73_07635 [Bacillus sp. (in: Bacteria)]|nr:hypothetical protein [Bacillus sp. (in: firmicutes)]
MTYFFLLFNHYMELPVDSLVGRYNVDTIIREHKQIGDVLVELSGCSNEIASSMFGLRQFKKSVITYLQRIIAVFHLK